MALHFRSLLVWQRSMDLVVEVYSTTRALPSHERFGICAQLQRAAVSVPANIAEGHERRSRKEFRRYLLIATGSLAEVETLLDLLVRLEYASPDALERSRVLADETGRMMSAIRRNLDSPSIGERDSDELPDAALV